MKFRSIRVVFTSVWAFSFMLLTQLSFADSLSKLSPADQVRVKNGEQVYFSQDISGKPWPRSIVYQRLKATPEEAAAIFHDYGRHQEFFPRVTQSKVISGSQEGKSVVDVSYIMDLGELPFWPYTHLGTENYTSRNTISAYDSEFGKSYQIQWNLLKADTLISSDGIIQFESLKEGDTLMVYNVLIVPGRVGSSLVASYAEADVKNAMKKFLERVNFLTTSNPALLDQEVQLLHTSLENQ